ncbi:AAA family ATPase [Aquisalimonas sp. APHAB1-3]|uniref:nucleotide-binding protein n=1 Tax=Aquisalimonas sp. APHAB1-3 TaxID=3402080 RepID=UPI003AB0EEB5
MSHSCTLRQRDHEKCRSSAHAGTELEHITFYNRDTTGHGPESNLTVDTPSPPRLAPVDESVTRRIVVINGKGGCGKTTVATNLAVWYAHQGLYPALFDHDPQTSSSRWLASRPGTAPPIHGVSVQERQSLGITRSWQLRVPLETRRVINDTPAGVAGLEMVDHVQGADVILIPVLPSSIDIGAGADFIRDLLLKAKIRRDSKSVRIGIIANRTKEHTVALQSLERFLQSLNIPVVARLRDTQNYLHAAEQGQGIAELRHPSRSLERELKEWQRLLSWVEQG